MGFRVRRGACDWHVHIFDPVRFPYFSGRLYTPAEASIDELRGLQGALQCERVVVVTPSVYGIDNSCTVNAVRQLGPRARGVAVIDKSVSASALDEMAAAGVRGVRLNFETAGERDPAAARRILGATAEQLAGRNWHIQINTNLSVIAARRTTSWGLRAGDLDHFSGAKAAPAQASQLRHLLASSVWRACKEISPPIAPTRRRFSRHAPLAQAIVPPGPGLGQQLCIRAAVDPDARAAYPTTTARAQPAADLGGRAAIRKNPSTMAPALWLDRSHDRIAALHGLVCGAPFMLSSTTRRG